MKNCSAVSDCTIVEYFTTTASWSDLFGIVESIGIIASIAIATYSIVAQRRAQQVSNYMTITAYHREIWKMPFDNPALGELFNPHFNRELLSLTYEEKQFLSFVFLHAASTFELSKQKNIVEVEGLRQDISDVLKLPAPKQFWSANKKYYNKAFVKFVDEAVAN
jgi:hypothetical protein